METFAFDNKCLFNKTYKCDRFVKIFVDCRFSDYSIVKMKLLIFSLLVIFIAVSIKRFNLKNSTSFKHFLYFRQHQQHIRQLSISIVIKM